MWWCIPSQFRAFTSFAELYYAHHVITLTSGSSSRRRWVERARWAHQWRYRAVWPASGAASRQRAMTSSCLLVSYEEHLLGHIFTCMLIAQAHFRLECQPSNEQQKTLHDVTKSRPIYWTLSLPAVWWCVTLWAVGEVPEPRGALTRQEPRLFSLVALYLYSRRRLYNPTASWCRHLRAANHWNNDVMVFTTPAKMAECELGKDLFNIA